MSGDFTQEWGNKSTSTAVTGFDGWDAAVGLFVRNGLGTGDGLRPPGVKSKLNGL
ncbi:hypothetical protein ACIA8H_32695 [Streptomyces goshikiensis]|uniref:hypothetical protein n=1 Tax=Streptomyces goshikiensis TaxID=1942 RepID=UPI00379E3904